MARGIFKQRGIQLQEIAITGTSEIFQAAQVLTQRCVQALWVTGDNTAFQGFDAIVRAARDAKLPLIINDPEFVQRGALIAVGTRSRQNRRTYETTVVQFSGVIASRHTAKNSAQPAQRLRPTMALID